MVSETRVCYHEGMNRLVVRGEGGLDRASPGGVRMPARILVVGSGSAWLEGVVDLLQLADYDVLLKPDWLQAERVIRETPPDLTILDLSDYVDSLDLPRQLTSLVPCGDVPILLLNSTGDDRIWHLERVGDASRGRVDLYAHSLLGPAGLLDKVEECLNAPAYVRAG